MVTARQNYYLTPNLWIKDERKDIIEIILLSFIF